VERLIAGLIARLPERSKQILLGSPERPSWFANTVHSVMNLLPLRRFPVLQCGGVLKGYRMKIDWNRHRSFVYGTWEPEVVKALSEVVSPGDVTLDIGAHIGFYSLLLARLVGPTGQVIAFEPLPGNFKILAENVELNHCSQVRAINKAVLRRKSTMAITIPHDQPLPGSVSLFTDYGGQTVVVEAVSLDEFVREARVPVNFIKMDVEGAEELVLHGGWRTIESHHPTLMIEIHHSNCEREKHPAVGLLQERRYEVQWVNRWPLTSHLLAKWRGSRP